MASTIRSTTQQQIDIEDVIDDLIVLKDGSCSLVLKANAINFGLLSEEEQDATIYAYAAFLNSLTFSIQILIRSDLKDISGYIKQLEEQEVKQNNPVKKTQIHNYKAFISKLITERNVLEKSFYIVIPFSTLELGIGKSMTAAFLKKKSTLPFEKSYIIEKAKANLEPKRDHVLRQLARIGLGARQLTTQELIQLLFSMYNASSTQGQKITNTSDYTVPLVQPAYIKPEENHMGNNSQDQSTPTQPTPPTTPAETPLESTPTPLEEAVSFQPTQAVTEPANLASNQGVQTVPTLSEPQAFEPSIIPEPSSSLPPEPPALEDLALSQPSMASVPTLEPLDNQVNYPQPEPTLPTPPAVNSQNQIAPDNTHLEAQSLINSAAGDLTGNNT